MVERNNHGHVVIALMNDEPAIRARLIRGIDGNVGWMSSVRGKSIMYDTLVEEIRNGSVIIHDDETRVQLSSIEGASLRAPEGDPDDRAVAFALAVVGAVIKPAISFSYRYIEQEEMYGKRRRPGLLRSPVRI